MSYLLLTSSGNFANISVPVFPYTTEINLPFDFINLDDNSIDIRDEGTKYDKRSCKASFLLPVVEQTNLNALLFNNVRAKNILLTVPSNGGFFPFGADKGDSNGFTVSIEMINTPSIQQQPFRYFKCEMLFTNVGSYPAYALPTEVDEGLFEFGDVDKLLMPQNMFIPDTKFTISINHTENSSAQYFDRGNLGDNAGTRFILNCNQSKCAAILHFLTNVNRSETFNVTSQDYYYMFGIDYGSGTVYPVKIASNKIIIRHVNYDNFEIELSLMRIRI
jgi:hypothetical protein